MTGTLLFFEKSDRGRTLRLSIMRRLLRLLFRWCLLLFPPPRSWPFIHSSCRGGPDDPWAEYDCTRRPEVPYGPPRFLSAPSSDGGAGDDDGGGDSRGGGYVIDVSTLAYDPDLYCENTRAPFTAEEAAMIVQHVIITEAKQASGREDQVQLALTRDKLETMIRDAYGTVRGPAGRGVPALLPPCGRHAESWRCQEEESPTQRAACRRN